MGKLEVLVAAMNQNDFSLAEKMNIRCDAVIANQAERNEVSEKETEYGKIRMFTTDTKGVGKNRNVALENAEGEIILFADDDVVYKDDVPENVERAFSENKDADMIIFSMDILKNGKITEKRHLKNKKLHIWNSLRYGTYTIAVKRKAITDNGIVFNENFGGGCIYSAGEDTIFIKNCFDKGLKVYSDEYVLGTCCKDTSSWFVGYNEKYFYDKGALVRFLFPKIMYVMGMYFAVHFKRETDVSVFKRIKLVYEGIIKSKKLLPYSNK